MNSARIFLAICLGLFLGTHAALAQRAGDWAFGLRAQPFLYWKYNKADWNDRPSFYPEAPRKFNGWAAALTASTYIGDRWGLSAELGFSRQKQVYNILNFTVTEIDHSETYYYTDKTFARLDYLKLPVFAFYNLEIGYATGLFLNLSAGAQVALSTGYRSEYKYFEFNSMTRTFTDSVRNTIIIKPKTFYQDFAEFDGSHSIQERTTNYIYNRIEFGLIGGVELQKTIAGGLIVSLGCRYEFGLTNIENKNADKGALILVGHASYPGFTRPATHNRRLVLNLGVSKIIE